MIIVGLKMLVDFKEIHADSANQVDAWISEVKSATWRTPMDIKGRYPAASILKDNEVVFNVRGNRYRVLAYVAYKTGVVQVKKVGTHDEYMKW